MDSYDHGIPHMQKLHLAKLEKNAFLRKEGEIA